MDRDQETFTSGSSPTATITIGTAIAEILEQLKARVDTYESSMRHLMGSSEELNGRFNDFIKELKQGLRQRDVVIKDQRGVIDELNTIVKEQGDTLEELKGRLSKVEIATAGSDLGGERQ